MAPRNANELRDMMYLAIEHGGGPVFIRYPRGSGPDAILNDGFAPLPLYQPEVVREGTACAIVSAGDAFVNCEAACAVLEREGIRPTLINARFIKPLDERFYKDLFARHNAVVTVESNSLAGGFGSAVLELASSLNNASVKILRLGYPDVFMPHGSNKELLRLLGLDADGIARSIKNFLT
jgi:1-deoxy-D-xylulose-5-phosphate synthase